MKMLSFNKSSSKPKIVHLTILLLSVLLQIYHTTALYTEGDLVQIDFPYACNISRFTFRYGNRAPSYNSSNPTSVSLPPNQNLTIKDGRGSNECFLHLTIDPVSRDDAGTYILTVYDENGEYVNDARVGLRVNYRLGKAACESSDPYTEGWIRLQCSADVGNIPGQIICYQNGMRVPPLTSPEENGETLNQIILARLDGFVYCCSSTKQNTTDMCECKDIGWDPVRNIAITNVADPCPVVLSSTQVPTISQSPKESKTTKPSISSKTKTTAHYGNENKNPSAPLKNVVIVSIFLILTCITLIAVLLLKVKQLADLVSKSLKVHESVELGQNVTETP